MENSILISIKKLLGIAEDYTHFDMDLIIHINSVFSILTQLGLGPHEGFAIKDCFAKWSDFITDNPEIEAVKSYVYLKVKLLFDPPTSGSVIDSTNRLISELEFRLNVIAEHGHIVPHETISNDNILYIDRSDDD